MNRLAPLRLCASAVILLLLCLTADAQSRRSLLLAKKPTATAAGTNSPATLIANLNRWYDSSVLGYAADTAVGSTALWTNLAYAGDHLTQATGGNRPLFKTSVQNGLPGILFDGSDDVLTMTSSGTHNSGTAMAIFQITQSPANYTMGLLDSSGGSQEIWMSRDGSGNVVARLTDTDGTTVESSDFAGDGTVITNAVMIGWAWDGSTVEFYRNGTNVGSSASAGGTVNMTLDRMGNANGLQFIGYMHEFAYWTNNKASDADMTSLWANYASNKWFAAPSLASFADDFNRADGDSLGASWTEIEDTDIASNQLSSPNTAFDFRDRGAAYTGTSCGSVIQYVKVTLVSGSRPGIIFRYTDASTALYELEFDSVNDVIRLCYYSTPTGTRTELAQTAFNVTFPHVVGATITGTGNSTAWRIWDTPSANAPASATSWDGGGEDVLFETNPSPAVDTGNYVGLGGLDSASAIVWDDFYGGGL
jgi:hypothetical protein